MAPGRKTGGRKPNTPNKEGTARVADAAIELVTRDLMGKSFHRVRRRHRHLVRRNGPLVPTGDLKCQI